jgi:ABC-type transport system involved in multi-copper enzyme maturation permease subunit
MPLAALITFLFFLYTEIPVEIIGDFTLSMAALFFIMTWVGLTYNDIEDPISEQLLILKAHSEKKYYMSKGLFLILVGIAISIITVFFPVIKNALVNFRLYNIMDILVALILHCFVAFTGSMTGSFLHPRIMKNRKQAITLTCLIALMAIVKISINDKMPLTRLVTWVFPPISDFMKLFMGATFYDMRQVIYILLLLGAYCLVLMVLQIEFLVKNKF